jgi:hypothetical protein
MTGESVFSLSLPAGSGVTFPSLLYPLHGPGAFSVGLVPSSLENGKSSKLSFDSGIVQLRKKNLALGAPLAVRREKKA